MKTCTVNVDFVGTEESLKKMAQDNNATNLAYSTNCNGHLEAQINFDLFKDAIDFLVDYDPSIPVTDLNLYLEMEDEK